MDTQDIQADFSNVYSEYSDAIFRFCHFKTSNRELARDLTQETFLKSFDYLLRGHEIKSIRPFLYKTATNLVIDWYKKKKEESLPLSELQERTQRGVQSGGEGSPSIGNPEQQAEIQQIIRVLYRLDEPYRDAIYMRYVEGLKLREISDVLGEKENVLSVRIHRGLKRLRGLIK